ncbi:MAG: hypothetical protein JXQ80_12690 [Bacteroidales bacterium]|nr:hypothetical protein [Bacteroidales bacterium]
MVYKLMLVLTGMLVLTELQGQLSGSVNSHENDPINALLLSFDYFTNANPNNINTGTRQPSFSPSVNFISRFGVDLSLAANFLGNSDDAYENYSSELDLMAGYQLVPCKHFTLYPSYGHYFHSNNSNPLKAFFTDEFRLDADYSPKILNAGISAGYLLGKRNTFYTEAHVSHTISIDNLFFKKDNFSLLPGVDVNFGDYEYLNLYFLDELTADGTFYSNLYNYPLVRRYVLRQHLLNPDMTYTEILYNYFADKASDNFKLTSLSLNIPFYYMVGKFGISAGIYIFVPISQPDYLSDDAQFYVNAGLSYYIGFTPSKQVKGERGRK